jgi:3-oxoadipate enol-lactonase
VIVKVNGTRMHYALDGPAAAPVVTMSHSLGTNLSLWDPQVPVLARQYRVLRYDVRGHGATEAPTGAFGLEHLVEDLRGLLHALGVARTHLVGLSLGGVIGQAFALKYPQLLHSLVLCNTTSRMPLEARSMWEERVRVARSRGLEPLVEVMLQRWLTPAFRVREPDVAGRVASMIRLTSPEGYVGCYQAIAALDLTAALTAIRLPTLIIARRARSGGAG